MTHKTIRIATRQSRLALFQANWVKSAILAKYPNYDVSLVKILTKGDKRTDVALNKVGGKSLFVKALQTALLNNEADIAVHCVKDMSVHPVEHLKIACILKREDPRDVLISQKAGSLEQLPKHSIVGTASPRRACLLKNQRPDLKIQLIRGNVDTRLQKCFDGHYDAIVLAAAGLHRLNLHQHICQYLPVETFTPAIGQGALAIECRTNNDDLIQSLQFLNDPVSNTCVTAERRVNAMLNGDCHSAIGVFANITPSSPNQLHLSAFVGTEDGKTVIRESHKGDCHSPLVVAEKLAQNLINCGALSLLRN